MANDVASKSTPSSVSGTSNVIDQTESNNTTPSSDQQKVPPLRIVLNTGGNQKSTSISNSDNNQSSVSKKDVNGGKTDSSLKSRVRIKLGTNKQTNNSIRDKSLNESTINRSTSTNKSNSTEDNLNDETSSSSYTHLRRITRRSQRTIQSINNEDEESISSMTSTDENIQNNTDLVTQDSEQSNSAPAITTSASNSATNGSNANSSDTPRRHKRRKGEPSESQSLDGDVLFGSQNYRLPDQNSIELYKNIRIQVDKRLRNLNNIQPRIPYGFKDYMLSRGCYLLDGNKLGNGTNLFMNEDGELDPPPIGKYHAIRQNRVSYTVPNRARVPQSLTSDSPLYELFIDQEKERHRMRMQHIKEREKLTLAVEQEIVRVYTQAALTASNQSEPFSACTMLKHQEIYDYLNSDGKIILSRENAQQDQVKPDGVRTRRRQHGQISPTVTSSTSRKNSNTDEGSTMSATTAAATSAAAATTTTTTTTTATATATTTTLSTTMSDKNDSEKVSQTEDTDNKQAISESLCDRDPLVESANSDENRQENSPETQSAGTQPVKETSMDVDKCGIKVETNENNDTSESNDSEAKSGCEVSENNSADESQLEQQQQIETSPTISDEDRRIQDKELFLTQLQEVDDKWDKIRKDMLIRHKNEAESLYAIQKLEWEWKTKEIGACDVRATPVIDGNLVPKLSIQSQDY